MILFQRCLSKERPIFQASILDLDSIHGDRTGSGTFLGAAAHGRLGNRAVRRGVGRRGAAWGSAVGTRVTCNIRPFGAGVVFISKQNGAGHSTDVIYSASLSFAEGVILFFMEENADRKNMAATPSFGISRAHERTPVPGGIGRHIQKRRREETARCGVWVWTTRCVIIWTLVHAGSRAGHLHSRLAHTLGLLFQKKAAHYYVYGTSVERHLADKIGITCLPILAPCHETR